MYNNTILTCGNFNGLLYQYCDLMSLYQSICIPCNNTVVNDNIVIVTYRAVLFTTWQNPILKKNNITPITCLSYSTHFCGMTVYVLQPIDTFRNGSKQLLFFYDYDTFRFCLLFVNVCCYRGTLAVSVCKAPLHCHLNPMLPISLTISIVHVFICAL